MFKKIIYIFLLIFSFKLIMPAGQFPNSNGGIHEIDKKVVFSFGAFFNAGYTRFKGNLYLNGNSSSSLNFDKGDGLNYSGGITAQYAIFKGFFFQLRAKLDNSSGTMNTDYYLPVINDHNAKTSHELKINLLYLGFDFLYKYTFWNDFYFLGGASYSIPIKSDYQQTVNIMSGEIEYSDGSSQRIFPKVKFDAINKISLKAGFGYPIAAINDNITIIPEINFEYPVSKIVQSSDFKKIKIDALLNILIDF